VFKRVWLPVGVLAGVLAVSSVAGASSSGGQSLKVTGTVTMTIALNKSDCTARPSQGGDIFQVALPSVRSQDHTFVFDATGPNSSERGGGVATWVALSGGGGAWETRFLQAPDRIPKKQLHFGPGGRSGDIDTTLGPVQGFHGKVHAVVKWSAADCGTEEPVVVVR